MLRISLDKVSNWTKQQNHIIWTVRWNFYLILTNSNLIFEFIMDWFKSFEQEFNKIWQLHKNLNLFCIFKMTDTLTEDSKTDCVYWGLKTQGNKFDLPTNQIFRILSEIRFINSIKCEAWVLNREKSFKYQI